MIDEGRAVSYPGSFAFLLLPSLPRADEAHEADDGAERAERDEEVEEGSHAEHALQVLLVHAVDGEDEPLNVVEQEADGGDGEPARRLAVGARGASRS